MTRRFSAQERMFTRSPRLFYSVTESRLRLLPSVSKGKTHPIHHHHFLASRRLFGSPLLLQMSQRLTFPFADLHLHRLARSFHLQATNKLDSGALWV